MTDDEFEDVEPSAGLTDSSWWVQAYDDEGSAYTTPQPYDVYRKLVIEKWKASVKDGALPMPELTDTMLDYIARKEFAAHVGSERNRRSNRLVKDAEDILDSFQEDGVYLDPLLSQVHRVGDGTDLVLRYWTAEIWIAWADSRFELASAAMSAANAAMKLRQRMVDALHAANVVYTGDLK